MLTPPPLQHEVPFWITEGIKEGRICPPLDFGGIQITTGGPSLSILYPKCEAGDPYCLEEGAG